MAIISLIFLLAGCSNVKNDNYFISPQKASWEENYFESINAHTKALGLTELRNSKVGPDSIEIRTWSGFGPTYLSGKIIRKDGDTWSGYFIPSHEILGMYKLPSPASGWNTLWHDLQELGILTLPDASELDPDESGLDEDEFILDGISYVIEYKTEDYYRTYMYPNPDLYKWPEAKSLIRIMEKIGKEFNGTPPECFVQLDEACWDRDHNKARKILESGCNPDWISLTGYSQLHYSSARGWAEGVELLLRYSKLINHQTIHGRTPLHEAVNIDDYNAADDYAKSVMLLLEAGSDLTLKDKNDQTALELAISLGHEKRADLIREKMKH